MSEFLSSVPVKNRRTKRSLSSRPRPVYACSVANRHLPLAPSTRPTKSTFGNEGNKAQKNGGST